MFKKTLYSIGAALALLLIVGIQPSSAQLIVVENDFRIVSVDQDDNRIGIAQPDADPKVRQNWLYLEDDVRLSIRESIGGGAFRDAVYTDKNVIFNVMRKNKGQLIKIHGGRDWDGSIDASKIWM